MTKYGTSPEFERELQELAAKSAHMYRPRNERAEQVICKACGGYTDSHYFDCGEANQ